MSEKRNTMSTCSFCGDDCSECRVNGYHQGSSASSSISSNFLLFSVPAALLFIILLIL